MFDSKRSTYAVDEINDDLINDNKITLESFSLDGSIPASLDLSTLFKSLTSFQGNELSSQEEQNSLQDQFNFDTVSVTKNSRGFDLEQSFSWIGNKLSFSQKSSNQQLFADNISAGLSSEGAFSATYSNDIFNYAYDASFEIAQTVYLGHLQGSLRADTFTYTPGAGNELSVFSGNGNIDYGDGHYDLLNLSEISVSQVSDYSFTEIDSGGKIFNPGNGYRIFDYITLDNGDKILFEGIDKIVFSDKEIDLTVNPNDTEYLKQWNLHMMGVQNAWNFTTGSDDVLVGVQDTGLGLFNDNIHPDLRLDYYYDLENLPDDFFRNIQDDDYGEQLDSHGTSVQGIIAATSDNGIGIAGINWNSDVYHSDVLHSNPGDRNYVEATQDMIDLADRQNQRLIINMSFSGENTRTGFEQLVAENQDDVLFVIATGNDTDSQISHPAILAQTYDNVIAVGASLQDGTRASYSNYGEGITLTGPTEVLTTGATRNLEFTYNESFDGTSAAAPNVAGVTSLVWSANPNLTAIEIKDILSETAYDLGVEGYDLKYGHGLVNADAAVRRAIALSYSDSLTGASINNSFSAVNASAYDLGEAEIDPLTGNNYSNQFTLEEDSLLLTQQVSDDSYLELVDNTTINLGATNSNEMITVSQDSFRESSGYDAHFALSDSLGEDNIFYNTIEV